MFNGRQITRAFAGPGNDTRQWVSYGIVQAGDGGDAEVTFETEDGAPHPCAPYVTVKLEPSAIIVGCRVASPFAGNGEASYSPFMSGDEVIVAVPGGSEMGGCVILGRMNSSRDGFPSAVAGMDTSKGAVAFTRTRSPYVFENIGGWMVRDARTAAALQLDPVGNWSMADGEGNHLIVNASAVELALGDLSSSLRFVPAGAGSGSTSSQVLLTAQGTMMLSAGGQPATGHAVTMEQVLNLIVNFALLLISDQHGSSTLKSELTAPTKVFDKLTFPATFTLAMTEFLAFAASATPFLVPPVGPVVMGGMFPPGFRQAALGPAFAVMGTPVSGPTVEAASAGVLMAPGIGRSSLIL